MIRNEFAFSAFDVSCSLQSYLKSGSLKSFCSKAVV